MTYKVAGSIRFNTTTSKMEIYNGEQWWQIDSTSPSEETGGTRGLFYGGNTSPSSNRDRIEFINVGSSGNSIDFGNLLAAQGEGGAGSADRSRGLISGGSTAGVGNNNIIQFVTIASAGNAVDFGDMTVERDYNASVNNRTRSVTGGSFSDMTNSMDYVTIQSTGNSVDFGDLTQSRQMDASCESPTRGIFMGGISPGPSYVDYDIIDYITTSTLGNATDFGNLIFDNYGGGGCSNAIRGIRGGGAYVPNTLQSEMEFITISTTGDAAAFGDLTTNAWYTAACSSPTRGVFGGGANPSRHNVIQFVQIMSKGNSIDFGDLLDAIYEGGGLSNGNGGLG